MSMQSPTPPRMTATEFLVWAEGRAGRHELEGGQVYAQAAERAAHREIKLAVHVALLNAVRKMRVPCHVEPDGATVVIDDHTAYEPDALVYCGTKVEPSSLAVQNPVIIVEVLSPSTESRDVGRKLAGYFGLPSVRHYLIVNPDQPLVYHHERRENGTIITHIIRDGVVSLDPPGIALALADIYETRS